MVSFGVSHLYQKNFRQLISHCLKSVILTATLGGALWGIFFGTQDLISTYLEMRRRPYRSPHQFQARYLANYKVGNKNSRLIIGFGEQNIEVVGSSIRFASYGSYLYRSLWRSWWYQWRSKVYLTHEFQWLLDQPNEEATYVYPIDQFLMFPHDLDQILTPMLEHEPTQENKISIYIPHLEDMVDMSFPVLPYDLLIKVLIEIRRYLTLPNTPPAEIRIIFYGENGLNRFLMASRHRIHESEQLHQLIGDE